MTDARAALVDPNAAIRALAQALTEAAVTDGAGIWTEALAVLGELNRNGWTVAALATPPTPEAPCIGEHDWEQRHPGDLSSCRRCWAIESEPAPPAAAAVRHASGETEDGCWACREDDGPPCVEAERDPEYPEVCRYCSHTVEDVP